MKALEKFYPIALLMFFFSILTVFQSIAQTQREIPKPRGPVDFSETSNVVIFIVIPLIIFILYLIWRKEIKKRIEKKEREKKNE
ncbi:hypothetical protein [Rhodonellum sp.]|uniref:hypothetical protein n=1 Tax=Rhodonellum sp. TaxID=2231180 RepID=UPI0027199EFE|nr:hypothetical protein [Rhodonellum sp.]MDO9554122.1 hypothetical protein [Rhodonellum sp.]